jgi:hypothetical protein
MADDKFLSGLLLPNGAQPLFSSKERRSALASFVIVVFEVLYALLIED